MPEGFQVSVKREDLTGSVLSGNKVCLLCNLNNFCRLQLVSQGQAQVRVWGQRCRLSYNSWHSFFIDPCDFRYSGIICESLNLSCKHDHLLPVKKSQPLAVCQHPAVQV